MTTLKDIAAKAGVSVMTVSNVINGNYSKVSQGTIEKVNQLIKEYDYVPNSAARMLSAKASRIIALCLSDAILTPDIKTNPFESPYNSKLIGIIQRTIQDMNYYLMLCGGRSTDSIINDLKTWNVEGAIFLAGYDPFIPEITRTLQFPMLFIDSYYEKQSLMNIGADDYTGGYLAGRYLLNANHREIGFVSNLTADNTLLNQRFQGFSDALKEEGITLDEDHIFNSHISYEGGLTVGRKLAERRDITAVFSTADIMAIGIMEGARLGGLTLPRDLSVIGFDDLDVANYVTPKLTTIHQDIEQKGTLVVEKLFQLIRNPEHEKEHIVMPVEIIERQSVMHL